MMGGVIAAAKPTWGVSGINPKQVLLATIVAYFLTFYLSISCRN
jgi:hypothetical protein